MQCSKCNRTFSNNTALQRHIYSKHEDPDTKRLSCHLCPKKFNSQASLSRHIKMHQGVYAHRCKYCQKGFVTKDHLQGHISSNHTGERAFACKQCSKSFLYRSGGSKGGRQGRAVQISSISCSFWGKLAKIIGWRPHLWSWRTPLWEILDPPLVTSWLTRRKTTEKPCDRQIAVKDEKLAEKKTVLLRERKRHTTRRVANTRSVILGGGAWWGGGYLP